MGPKFSLSAIRLGFFSWYAELELVSRNDGTVGGAIALTKPKKHDEFVRLYRQIKKEAKRDGTNPTGGRTPRKQSNGGVKRIQAGAHRTDPVNRRRRDRTDA